MPLEGSVTFDTNGVLTSGITHTAGGAGITLVDAGTYKFSFSVSATEPNQMALFVDGVAGRRNDVRVPAPALSRTRGRRSSSSAQAAS